MQSRICDKVLAQTGFVTLLVFFFSQEKAFISLRQEPFPEFLDIICWLLCIYKDVLELVEISFKEEVYSLRGSSLEKG